MSGYIGLVSKSITEQDEQLLNRCQEEITSVCDDYTGKWKSSKVDLRFGLFRANDDTDEEYLPYTTNQNHFIVGDVRLDKREALITELNKEFPELNIKRPDSYLVLHSYLLWGPACVNHIAGDYSFVIWNENDGTLFCARDHFGVIPFYYAQIERGFIFTNFYHALKEVNELFTELNEEILKNYFFLSVGDSHYSTIYKKIHKLPPAHTLTYSKGNLSIKKYWTPRLPNKLNRFATLEEYITRFTEIFERSVKDRTRNKNVATHLSGGMDSSSVTAIVNKVLSQAYPHNNKLIAYNLRSSHLVTEREGYFANLIANQLDIDLKQFTADDSLKKISLTLDGWIPEPGGIPGASPSKKIIEEAESSSLKVLLTGFGSDVLFRYNTETWTQMLKNAEIFCFCKDIVSFYRLHGQLPHFGIIRRLSKIFKLRLPNKSKIPTWLKRSYISKEYIQSKIGTASLNSGMFSNGLWQTIFEQSHQGFSKHKVKVRHPFFSLELIEFLFAVPPHLLFNKYLLRLSMNTFLPAAIVHRPKTLLYGDFLLNNFIASGVLKELSLKIMEEEEFLKDKIDAQDLLSLLCQPNLIKSEDQNTINNLINILAWKTQINLREKYFHSNNKDEITQS